LVSCLAFAKSLVLKRLETGRGAPAAESFSNSTPKILY
jgi:hypothetical protein